MKVQDKDAFDVPYKDKPICNVCGQVTHTWEELIKCLREAEKRRKMNIRAS